MNARIKQYIKGSPILIAPLHVKVIHLLNRNHIELHVIAIINIHNYLISLDKKERVQV